MIAKTRLTALCLLPVALLLAAASAPVPALAKGPAQKKKAKGERPLIAFEGHLAAAKTRARERNVPIFLFAVLDGEDANDKYAEQLSMPNDLSARQDEFLVLMGNDGNHDQASTVVGWNDEGEPIERQLCSVFHTPTCKDHQQMLDVTWGQYAEDGKLDLPRLIQIGPDGEVYDQLYNGEPLPDDEVLETLKSIQKQFGPGLSEEEFRSVRAQLKEAKQHLEAKEFGKAWHKAEGVLKTTSVATYADPAKLSKGDAEKGLAAALEELKSQADAGQVLDVYKRCLKYTTTWADTPQASSLSKFLKKLERAKGSKDIIKAYKNELAAEELWNEAMALAKDGKKSKSDRLLKNILRRYADTPAGKRTADKYPHLVEADK